MLKGVRGSTVFGLVLGVALVVSFISSRRGGADGGVKRDDSAVNARGVIAQTREVEPFDGISLAGVGDVTVTSGAEPSLVVSAPENLLDELQTRVKNDTLTISVKRGARFLRGGRVSYRIVTPTLERLELSGTGDVHAERVAGDDVTLSLSGSGDLDVQDLRADDLEVDLSGEGDMQLVGEVTEQSVTVSGVGDYRACALQSQDAEVEVSGVGDVLLWASETLDADVSGVGDVRYRGDPEVSADVSGVGSVAASGRCN